MGREHRRNYLLGWGFGLGQLLEQAVEIRFVVAVLSDAEDLIFLFGQGKGDGMGDFAFIIEDFLLSNWRKASSFSCHWRIFM